MKHIYSNILFVITAVIVLLNTQLTLSQQDSALSDTQKEYLNFKKKPWKGNNAFLTKYLNSIEYYKNKDKIRYVVPVKFWVYRNNDGSGGASYTDIDKFINDLNYYYSINKTGIRFYLREIKFINKTKRTILGYYVEAPLLTLCRHTRNVINIHVVDGFKIKKGVRQLIRGNFNYLSNAIIIRKINSSTSLAHEVGHYFGLLHPHRNYNKGKSKQEPVSRTRYDSKDKNKTPLCQLRGDYLSDTPAEPKLSFLVNNDCEFVGGALTDDWGDNYKPNVNNIMSYPSNYYCRDNFTESQVAVMLFSAHNNKYQKYWTLNRKENLKYLFDSSEPNDYFEMASPIKLDTIQKFNFHKIFISKNKDKNDSCDWYKFEIKDMDKHNVNIVIKPQNNNVGNIEVALFDKNKIQLCENTEHNKQPIYLKYNNLVSDWYYIKVNTTQISSKKTNDIDTYSIEIILN